MAKTAIKSIKKGKLDLSEAYDVIESVGTLLDGQLTLADAEAVFNLVSPVSTKELKGAKNFIKGTDKAGDATKNRVKLRKGTKEKIKENAPKTAYGKYFDPNTLKPIDGPHDIGHKTGQEWRTRKKMHQEKGSTRKEVIEAENDPDLYHIEYRSSNRSHKYEKKG